MNIINGMVVDKEDALRFLEGIDGIVRTTLKQGGISPETVIGAADTLSRELMGTEPLALLLGMGIAKERATAMLREAAEFLSRGYLETKLLRELGVHPFEWRQAAKGALERLEPLGVLTHIAAGNASGLPAFSVLEGLLAGNVNLLKLPGADDGISTALLLRLIEIEPRLVPYIQVFDLPSTDAESIKKLLAASDAVAVWGSDFAVSGIRALASPNVQLIEWGHRLSFAWVTKAGETPEALGGFARDVCGTEQLLCSSPQCVYYEADSFEELKGFAVRFARAMEMAHRAITSQKPEPAAQADITAALLLAEIEELVEDKFVIRGGGWSVVADWNEKLVPSPMYRNVWVKPLREDMLLPVLRPMKGYLQTVGLACAQEELEPLCEALYRCGACRVTAPGMMASNYAGEPHDGAMALRRYTKTVVRRV